MSIKVGNCKIFIAQNDVHFDAVFAIRHAVYSEELGFEPKRDDKRETTPEDMRAIHLLATDDKTGAPIGTVRLILPQKPGDHPFRRTYQEHGVNIPLNYIVANEDSSPSQRFVKPHEHNFLQHQSSEISRLAVVRTYRCGKQRNPSCMSTSLLLLMAATVVNANIKMDNNSTLAGAYFITTRAIINFAARHGITGFHQIAPEIDHHGKRAAYWIRTSHVEKSMTKTFNELYQLVKAGILEDMTRGPKASVYAMDGKVKRPLIHIKKPQP